jgi:uncharacterized UPF0160 family protein
MNQIKIRRQLISSSCYSYKKTYYIKCIAFSNNIMHSSSLINRTRDEEVLKTCDIVVDVGSVYDPPNLRFDHHQK